MLKYGPLLVVWWTILYSTPTIAAESAKESAIKIALIIDDMGNHKDRGIQALKLPGAVTYAFLPQTPHTWNLASEAHRRNKEIMLHLPMESNHNNPLGRGALTLDMPKAQFLNTLRRNISSVPYLSGVNNHMGSLLTRDPTAMRWLMSVLKRKKLYFIDSRTTSATMAQRVAQRHLIPNGRRDIFLDNLPRKADIRKQWLKLLDTAQTQGRAIGIGHPYPATLEVLQDELPKLQRQGVKLVPVSQIIARRTLWHVSSSPSPKGVKNSKRSASQIY
jgi:polysaccharide deacetylase 2 family uncharacterized protein YibQ